jgi:hypothetical protein
MMKAAVGGVQRKLVAETEKERGALEYQYTANNEENGVDVIGGRRDSKAVIAMSLKRPPKVARNFWRMPDPGGVVVYRSPSDEAKNSLKDFNPAYFTAFDGFTREAGGSRSSMLGPQDCWRYRKDEKVFLCGPPLAA